jgi:hypothetical protein
MNKFFMKNLLSAWLLVFLCYYTTFSQSTETNPPWVQHGVLSVSEDNHSLVHADGTPFFWLGETSWALHQNLSREDVIKYLDDTKAAGYNIIQLMTVNIWALDSMKNYYGDNPYLDNDATKLNPPYWDHLGWVIDQAALRGMYVLLSYGAPGRKDNHGPIVNTPLEAYRYSYALGKHYASKPNLIWASGMDANPNDIRKVSDMGMEGWFAMAEGATDGVSGVMNMDGNADWNATLMVFHPSGGKSSSEWFHDASWLDFNGAQVGMRKDQLINTISTDFNRPSVKPIVNLEPWYEGCVWKNPVVDAWDVRVQAYQSVFAGAFGHTYGHIDIYYFDAPGERALKLWREILSSPGRMQMMHLKNLFESYHWNGHSPLPGFVIAEVNDSVTRLVTEYIPAIMGNDGSWAFVYTPEGKPFSLKLDLLKKKNLYARWYNPANGLFHETWKIKMSLNQVFTPPVTSGAENDWVLCVSTRKT